MMTTHTPMRPIWWVCLSALYLITGAQLIFLIYANFEIYKNPRASLPLGIAEVVSYTPIVEQGDSIRIRRRVIDEPDNCQIYVRRFLSPINNTQLELLIFEEVRKSYTGRGVGNVVEFQTKIPDNLPIGTYMYYAKLEYYCTWVQRVFGPGKFTNQPVLVKVVAKGTKDHQ